MDTLDRLFGPMRPEADEEALLLGGHRVIGGDVLGVMRELSASDVDIVITFSQISALSMDHMPQRYIIDLVLGYHDKDPERRATKVRDDVIEELDRAKRYYELMAGMSGFPELYYVYTKGYGDDTGEAEFVWGLSERSEELEHRQTQSARMLRNLANIRKAVTDKEAFSDTLGDELRHMHRVTYV